MEHDAFKGVIIVKDGVQKKVSFEELCLSNTMSLEALVALLVKKKIIKPDDLLEAIRSIKNERYRTGEPPQKQ
ncbi:MAG: hypothetical protein MUE60_03815 [Candidatus Eisenbacteria bacterium]|nr:hypothetical protein [Candidatus Eisenbacteria bacterium]